MTEEEHVDEYLRRIASLEARVEELEAQLRIWRDNYAAVDGGAWVAVPVHQLVNVLGDPREAVDLTNATAGMYGKDAFRKAIGVGDDAVE